jgi:hypothetical protein
VIGSTAASQQLRDAIVAGLTQRRRLDQGNADPRSIGTDFARFKMAFWNQVDGLDKRNPVRRRRLAQLNIWRNAIAHQDFDFTPDDRNRIAGTRPTLPFVRTWRSACDTLAEQFDLAVVAHLTTLTGARPWQ